MVINYNGESYIIPNKFIEEVRADERKNAEQDFENGEYWNDYLAQVLADERKHIVDILFGIDRQVAELVKEILNNEQNK